MSIAQEAIRARQDATVRLQELLVTVNDLDRVLSLKSEYHAQYEVATKNVRTVFTANTEQLSLGLENLRKAKLALGKFQKSLQSVETICSESSNLVSTDNGLRELAVMHSNLKETLKSAETVAGLPDAAEKGEKMLLDDQNATALLGSYTFLSQLEAVVFKIKTTLDSLNDTSYVLPNLDTYFKQVYSSMKKVEHRLWSITRSFLTLGRTNPEILVAAMKVIEIQEAVDAKLLSDGLGDCPIRKGWRRQCIQNMSAAISEAFAPLLQKSSKLLSSDEDAGQILEDILTQMQSMIDEMYFAIKYLEPCFPPHYHVSDFVTREYSAQLENIIDLIGTISEELSNGDILFCMEWVQRHRSLLISEATSFEDISGIRKLMYTYVNRMENALRNWLRNIMNSDFRSEPTVSPDGELFTPGPQDMFRLLEEQINIARQGGATLLVEVAQIITKMLYEFAQQYRHRIKEVCHPLETLCAIGNNCLRSVDLHHQLQQMINHTLSAISSYKIDHSLYHPDFDSLGREAAESCARVVFMDPGFGELFSSLCCSEDWLSGVATGSVLATLDDFFRDFRVWLDPKLFQIMTTAALIECVSHYMAAILAQLRLVNDSSLHALQKDSDNIQGFFQRFLPDSVVQNECQCLIDIFEFLTSDSVEAFVLSYSALLDSVAITPVLLYGVLNARVASQHDMTKADAKEVLTSCREVYDSVKAASKESQSKYAMNPSIQNAAFIAALSAVRQRY